MWYKNGIPSVYHLSIRAKHVSVLRTEPIDKIHYAFHASLRTLHGVQLVVFEYLVSVDASIVVLWRRRVSGVAPGVPEACQDIHMSC